MELVLVLLGALLFAGSHIGISSTGLREQWIARFGQPAYLGFYSGISFATLAFLIWAYASADHGPALWPTVRWLPLAVMPFALLFTVGGFAVPNPTSVGAEARIGGDAARGMLRVARHPVMTGFLLWALSHLIANGDAPSLVFFAAFAVVAGVGMVSIDRRKAESPTWPEFAAATSLLPFAAIAAGRNRFVAGELLLPAAIAAVLYGAMIWGHSWLSGGVALF